MARLKSEKPFIVIFLLTVAILIGLIVLAARMPRGPIIPPETPEQLALRRSPQEQPAERQPFPEVPGDSDRPRSRSPRQPARPATRNAYFVLEEALSMLPEKPKALALPEGENSRTVLYDPPPRSLGAILDIPRPENDRQLLAYLEGCEPLIRHARLALDHDVFRYPEGIHYGYELDTALNHKYPVPLGSFAEIPVLFIAKGLHLSRKEDRHEEALHLLIDGLDIHNLMLTDGGTDLAWSVSLHMRHATAFSPLAEVAARVTSADALRDALGRLDHIIARTRPPTAILESELRVLDALTHVNVGGADESSVAYQFLSTFGFEDRYSDFRARRNLRLIKGHFRQHRDEMFTVLEMSWPAFRDWAKEFGDREEDLAGISGIFGSAEGVCWSILHLTTRQTAFLEGSRLILALELHYREHGFYPEKLADLVPGCLPGIPRDPCTGAPDWYYRRVGTGYMLVSAGYDMANGWGDRSDTVIHSPWRPEPEKEFAGPFITTWSVLDGTDAYPHLKADDVAAHLAAGTVPEGCAWRAVDFVPQNIEGRTGFVEPLAAGGHDVQESIYLAAIVHADEDTLAWAEWRPHGMSQLWAETDQVTCRTDSPLSPPVFFSKGDTPLLVHGHARSSRRAFSLGLTNAQGQLLTTVTVAPVSSN